VGAGRPRNVGGRSRARARSNNRRRRRKASTRTVQRRDRRADADADRPADRRNAGRRCQRRRRPAQHPFIGKSLRTGSPGAAPEIPGEASKRRARKPAEIDAFEAPAGLSREEILIEFEQRPLLEPPYPVVVPRPRAPGRPRRLAFVLHAHLPWVLGHGTWPHGEEWLAEAVAHCYLPLFDAFRRLAERGGGAFVTVSVTPVLAAAARRPAHPPLVDRYLAERTKAAAESRGRSTRSRSGGRASSSACAPLGVVRSRPRRAPRRARGARRGGALHLRRHPPLPAARSTAPSSSASPCAPAARRTGELFGVDPRGCWMPECAYRPGGPWQHPVTGASRGEPRRQRGVPRRAGAALDGGRRPPAARGGSGYPYLSDLAPRRSPSPAAPHPKPYWIRRSSVAAFLRDARTAAQVWSRQGGYPGDGAYLDFHKRHWPSGLRLWRVTGPSVDLGDKLAYWPDDARQRAREQASTSGPGRRAPGMGGRRHLCPVRRRALRPLVVRGADLARARPRAGATRRAPVEATTPRPSSMSGPRLRRAATSPRAPGARAATIASGSAERDRCGSGASCAELEPAAFAAVPPAPERPRPAWRLRAILNQLLLAAASDWPFLVTTGHRRPTTPPSASASTAAAARAARARPAARQLPTGSTTTCPSPVGSSPSGPFPPSSEIPPS
jgi:hypothetical protein